MNLYFNGCSTTYGQELKNPKKDSWPAIVSYALNADYYNDAVPGGSNERIVYKTMQVINKYDFFFISWATYTRFTEYNPVDNFEINFGPLLNLDPSMHYSDDLKINYSKYKKYGEMYYKYWYNELYKFKRWLQEIILLQSFLDSQNKKYLMFNNSENNLSLWLQPKNKFIGSVKNLIDFSDYLDDSQLLEEHYKIQHLVSLINKDKFLEWNSWNAMKLCSTFPCGPEKHLLEDGHKEIAKKIIDFYNTL